MYRSNSGSSLSSQRLSFPLTKAVLWDHEPYGPPGRLHLASLHNPQVCIDTLVLEQALKYAEDSRDSYVCFLIGSLIPDGAGVQIHVDRFELGTEGRRGSTSYNDLVTLIPGDIAIPCVVSKNEETLTPVADYIAALQTLEKRLPQSDRCGLQSYLSVKATICITGTREVKVNFDLVTLSTQILATPIQTVPLVATPLCQNLLSPLNVGELQGEFKMGYLTMDHTRKLIVMMDNDPKVESLPLVGLWVTGVDGVDAPFVWCALMKYLNCTSLKDRVCLPPEPFLLAIFTSTERHPLYYDMAIDGDYSTTQYQLHTGFELVQMAKRHQDSSRSGVAMELYKTDSGPKFDSFFSALEQMTVVPEREVPRKVDEVLPRTSPAPSLSVKSVAASPLHEVPEVTLLGESEFEKYSDPVAELKKKEKVKDVNNNQSKGSQSYHSKHLNADAYTKQGQLGHPGGQRPGSPVGMPFHPQNYHSPPHYYPYSDHHGAQLYQQPYHYQGQMYGKAQYRVPNMYYTSPPQAMYRAPRRQSMPPYGSMPYRQGYPRPLQPLVIPRNQGQGHQPYPAPLSPNALPHGPPTFPDMASMGGVMPGGRMTGHNIQGPVPSQPLANQPSVFPNQPGFQSAQHGFQSNQPGLQQTQPTHHSLPSTPTVMLPNHPSQHGLQTSQPSFQPGVPQSQPGAQQNQPGIQPSLTHQAAQHSPRQPAQTQLATGDAVRQGPQNGLIVPQEQSNPATPSTPPVTPVSTSAPVLCANSLDQDSIQAAMATAPADVYALIKSQDAQLKQLQQQLQMLLLAQKGETPKETPAEKSQTVETSAQVSAVVNTSMPERNNETADSGNFCSPQQQTKDGTALANQSNEPLDRSYPAVKERDGVNSSSSSSELTTSTMLNGSEGFFSNDKSIPFSLSSSGLQEDSRSTKSDIVVDLPEYSTESSQGDDSPVIESVSMYDDQKLSPDTTKGPEQGDQADNQVHGQVVFYEKLIDNIQHLLEGGLGVTESSASSQASAAESEVLPARDLAFDALEQLRQMTMDMKPEDLNTDGNMNKSLCDLGTTVLQRINYVSMMFEDSGDTDMSMEVNALAMKYLGKDDALPVKLKKQPLLTPQKSTVFNDNNMSFATKKYFQRHGLVDSFITTKLPSVPDISENLEVDESDITILRDLEPLKIPEFNYRDDIPVKECSRREDSPGGHMSSDSTKTASERDHSRRSEPIDPPRTVRDYEPGAYSGSNSMFSEKNCMMPRSITESQHQRRITSWCRQVEPPEYGPEEESRISVSDCSEISHWGRRSMLDGDEGTTFCSGIENCPVRPCESTPGLRRSRRSLPDRGDPRVLGDSNGGRRTPEPRIERRCFENFSAGSESRTLTENQNRLSDSSHSSQESRGSHSSQDPPVKDENYRVFDRPAREMEPLPPVSKSFMERERDARAQILDVSVQDNILDIGRLKQLPKLL